MATPKILRSPKHYEVLPGVQAYVIQEAVLNKLPYDAKPMLAYYLGSAMKYMMRCTSKGELRSDIDKMISFLQLARATFEDAEPAEEPEEPAAPKEYHGLKMPRAANDNEQPDEAALREAEAARWADEETLRYAERWQQFQRQVGVRVLTYEPLEDTLWTWVFDLGA